MPLKIRSMKRGLLFLIFGIFVLAFAAAAFAQEEAKTEETTKWKRKPTLAFQLGGFFPTNSMKVRVDGEEKGTFVDLEEDLGLDKDATTLRGDGDIRIAEWFSLDLGFYGFSRSNDKVIDKDIQIGNTIFPVHQTVNTRLNTTYLNADFKFYLLHRERLDFGVYAGIYLAHYKLRVEAVERDLNLLEFKKVWAPIPSIGLHFGYTIAPNLYLSAKAGYFHLKPSKRTLFDSATASINLDWYFYKFLGIGARYEYGAFDLDLDVASYHGNMKYNIGGFQVYALIGLF